MSLMSSIKLPQLHKIIFISDVDVALSDQYIFIEEIDGLLRIKTKLTTI
uniref:ORF115 n=1 Tax=Pieris brassicae granulosis virus TaxID=10465 RepID=A0A7G9U8L4_GVPB|nr:ORF115 [Pieris brassicae granulovirus]